MRNPETVVVNYIRAIGERDLDRARGYLSDEQFFYTSPIGSYDDADKFMHSLFGVGPILEKLEIKKLFSADNEVMMVVDAVTTLSDYSTYHIAMWFEVEDGSIIAMDTFFDASPYKEMFIEQSTNVHGKLQE